MEAFDIGRSKPLDQEFAEMEAEAGVQEELDKLKARLGNRIPVATAPQPARA